MISEPLPAAPRSRSRNAALVLALGGFEVGAIAVLHRLGEIRWMNVPWSSVRSWLDIAPTAGSTAGGTSDTLTVSVDVSGLITGTYIGTVTVDAGSAGQEFISVQLVVGGFVPNVMHRVTEYSPTAPELLISLAVWAIGFFILTMLYKIALTVRKEV